MSEWIDTSGAWHASDCGGSCDGCGHIAADGFWYAGPAPEHLKDMQQVWAEGVPSK